MTVLGRADISILRFQQVHYERATSTIPQSMLNQRDLIIPSGSTDTGISSSGEGDSDY